MCYRHFRGHVTGIHQSICSFFQEEEDTENLLRLAEIMFSGLQPSFADLFAFLRSEGEVADFFSCLLFVVYESFLKVLLVIQSVVLWPEVHESCYQRAACETLLCSFSCPVYSRL